MNIITSLETVPATEDGGEFRFSKEADLYITSNEKKEEFPILSMSRKFNVSFFTEFVTVIVPRNYKPVETLICDWTHETDSLCHYENLKSYVRHGMEFTLHR